MPNQSYTPLEGNSLSSLGITAPSFSGGTASFLATSTFVYTLFFVAIVGAAFYRYGLAGVLRMNASENTIRRSNEIFRQVTLGLLGVFSLFLILFTVNKGLVTGDVGLSELRSIRGGGVNSPGSPPPTATPPGPAAGAPGGSGTTPADEAAARAPLLAAGITFNKDGCPNASATNCTNIGGVRQDTVTMLLSLKSSCGCSVVITGGTEGGHSANSRHGVGKEAVDIRFDEQLASFLSRSGTPVANGIKWGGFVFWDEPVGADTSGNANSARHYHVSYTGR